MFTKQYVINNQENMLGNKKEIIYKVLSIKDKLNHHLLFMKKVLDKGTEKLKTFIITFNEEKLKVHQFELNEDIQLDDVKEFLTNQNLFNQPIYSTTMELWQDSIYVNNLSKRYSIENRQHPVLKEIFMDSMPELHYKFEKSNDILNDFILSIVFYKINKLKFIKNVEQLQNLTNSEKELFLTSDALPNDVQYKLNDKIVFTTTDEYVKRVDISPLYLFTDKLKLKEFINHLDLIPYKEKTECHFYLNEIFFKNYISLFDLNINQLLINSYNATNLIRSDLRYVAFVESVKKVNNVFRKFDTLKTIHPHLYEKEFSFIKDRIEHYDDVLTTFYLTDIFFEVEKNISNINIDYPTYKLDNWLLHKETYLKEHYDITPILNHRDFSRYVLEHLTLREKEFIFKGVDVDYLAFSNHNQSFVLEVKTVSKNVFKLKHIYTKRNKLTETEKNIIVLFCQLNNIKFNKKEHILFR